MGGYSGNPADVAAYNARAAQDGGGARTGLSSLWSNSRFGQAVGGKLVGPAGANNAVVPDAIDSAARTKQYATLLGSRMSTMGSSFVAGSSGTSGNSNVGSYGASLKQLLGS